MSLHVVGAHGLRIITGRSAGFHDNFATARRLAVQCSFRRYALILLLQMRRRLLFPAAELRRREISMAHERISLLPPLHVRFMAPPRLYTLSITSDGMLTIFPSRATR